MDSDAKRSKDDLAAAVILAQFAENPKRRYMVVPSQQEAEWTIGKAVRELAQLNDDQPYAYSRDDLIGLLDEALAAEAE